MGANFGAPEYQFFSPDLSVALVEPYDPEPPLAPAVAAPTPYLRDDRPLAPEPAQRASYAQAESNSAFLAPGFAPLISKLTAPEAPPASASGSFLAATPDMSHIVLQSSTPLTGPASGAGLYEWSQGNTLRPISVLPGGQPASSMALGYFHTRAHSISANGNRVFWTANQVGPAHLYMRNVSAGQTVQLDKAQEAVTEPSGAAKFQTASSDGSRVFFTDDQNLVPEASGEAQLELSDLYECELASNTGEEGCVLRDLTLPVRSGEHAAVQGFLLGAGEDGSTVYLVASGVLADNENGSGETATAGRDNLYELRYAQSKWSTTFIATLSAEDSPDWDQGKNVSAENTAFQTSRVSSEWAVPGVHVGQELDRLRQRRHQQRTRGRTDG